MSTARLPTKKSFLIFSSINIFAYALLVAYTCLHLNTLFSSKLSFKDGIEKFKLKIYRVHSLYCLLAVAVFGLLYYIAMTIMITRTKASPSLKASKRIAWVATLTNTFVGFATVIVLLEWSIRFKKYSSLSLTVGFSAICKPLYLLLIIL